MLVAMQEGITIHTTFISRCTSCLLCEGVLCADYGCLQGDYSEDCNSQNQLRCELGDLSGKHGRYTIETSAGTVGRQLSQDIDLPLFGPTSGVLYYM